MNLLAIESATEFCSVALSLGGRVIDRCQHAPREHAGLLIPWTRELLADAGIGYAALDGIAVTRGPGGFTSLRIGLGVAQGLALAHDLPLYPVSTLAVCAWAGREHGDRLLVALDARMGEVYAAGYRYDGTQLHAGLAEQVVAPDRISQPPAGSWQGLGSGFGVHAAVLEARLGPCLAGVHPLVHPNARALLALAGQASPQPAADLVPVYLRDRVADPAAEAVGR